MPPRLHVCSVPPCLHTSTSLRHQRASRPPCLHVATHVAILQRSTPPCLHVTSPTAGLHTSIPPYRYTYSAPRPPDLHTSVSLCLQRASRFRTLHLHDSIPRSAMHNLQHNFYSFQYTERRTAHAVSTSSTQNTTSTTSAHGVSPAVPTAYPLHCQHRMSLAYPH